MVFGIDGGTLAVIRPLAAQGRLPNFARLMAEGAFGTLRSTIHPLTAPAWTSFMTGVNPGKHAVFDFTALAPGSYGITYTNAGSRRAPSLWRLLSEAGRRVAVVNVPFTYPPEEVNGVLISGLDTPSPRSPFIHPPELRARLEAACGPYVLMVEQDRGEGRTSYVARVMAMVEARRRAALYLLEAEPWDFFMVVFSATDILQHSFWRYYDPAHPDHDPAEARRFGGVIPEVYERADAALGEMLARLGPDVHVVVMSDHGFGPFLKGVYLNRWLEAEGLLARREGQGAGGMGALLRGVKARLPQGARALAKNLLPGLKEQVNSYLVSSHIDWAATKAFSFGVHGSLVINLAGRQPQGTVQPGADYEALRTRITQRLSEMADPQTGERVVERVWRREELYHGPYVELAPDLIITWRDYAYTAQQDYGEGRGLFHECKTFEFTQREHNGSHRLEGVFMLWGESARRGAEVSGARIIDLAPTVLHLMGEPVPAHMDGRVLAEALREGFLTERPVRLSEGAGAAGGPGGAYSDEEAAQMEERLKNLGYL
jgi:predicted AlkP superfamily phosphohydrolase/phosphomutase